MDTRNIGLRNIEVADTKISSIDGSNGKLIYRGYDILDLVNHSTFEETSYLLLFGELPRNDELYEFSRRLKDSRTIPHRLIKNLENRLLTARPMDVLQSSVSELADYDPNLDDDTKDANLSRAINLISKMPTIVAAWERIRNHKEIVPPSIEESHASNFLYMLRGTKPPAQETKIFDVCLILHAEHSFNASTFAAREIASSRAHMYSCIGGANVQVMKMLLEMNDRENVGKWVQSRLDAGGRIMGMGHAVYKTTDPRSEVLLRLSRIMSHRKKTRWYGITEEVERITEQYMMNKRKQAIYTIVDLYSAPLYYDMGIPMDLNTPVFAISRIVGWSAHIIEEKFAEAAPKPALYRPKALYVGRYCGPMGCEYIPMESRIATDKPHDNMTSPST